MPGLTAAVDISIAYVGDTVGQAAWLGAPNGPWRDLFHTDEQERRSRLRFANDRKLLTLAHALLRTELSRHAVCAPGD